MPKISTYSAVAPQGNDLLLGTDANNNSVTKNFLISDLAIYIANNLPAIGYGLQYVLDNGNIATGNINLTGDINLIGNLSVRGSIIDSSSSTGTSGQFLKSTGTGTAWGSGSSLNEVLSVGATSGINVTLTGQLYSTEARIIKLRDYLNSAGTAGQVLMSTGTQVYWTTLGTPNIDQVLTVGGTSTHAFTTTAAVTAGNVNATNYVKPTTIVDRLNSVGTSGQVLKSTGTGVEWVTSSLSPQGLSSVLAIGNTATNDINLTGNLLVSGIATLGKIKDASASVGTSGQVLSSTGTALQWVNLPSTPTLSQVLAAGNAATNSINLTGNFNLTGILTVNGTVTPSTITDLSNSVGTPSQILSSTGTGIQWVNLPSTPTLNQVLTAGNTTSLNIITTGFIQPSTIKDILGSVGTSGQILSSTGSGVQWINSTITPSLAQVLSVGSNAAMSNISNVNNFSCLYATAQQVNISNLLIVGGSFQDSYGSTGTSGQILQSTGSAVKWVNNTVASTPTLNSVLTAGNATSLDIITSGAIQPNIIRDSLYNTGGYGQYLTVSPTTGNLLWLSPTKASYYSNISQAAVVINTGYVMTLNASNFSSSDVSVVSNSRITFSRSGYYNIQFSAQLDRVSGSGTDTVDIWFRKNGVDIADSNTKVTMTGAANACKTVAAWNFALNINANDYVELVWATSSTSIQIIAAASNSVHPATPSLIVTVNQI